MLHVAYGDEMARPYLPPVAVGAIDGIGASPRGNVQPGLFPKRISTIYPGRPNGADIAFMCEVAEGGTYYCKSDRNGRQVRLTEWFCTRLAAHLGVATADCAILENENGESYFGSLHHKSTVQDFAVGDFLRSPRKGELGQPSEWPGRYLSSLYSLDLFLNNADREMTNFALHADGLGYRLCAIDFAASRLASLTGREFPIAHGRTLPVGKLLRHVHGFFEDSALEMVDRIAGVPAGVLGGFLAEIPADWASDAQKVGIGETWSSSRMHDRLADLRAGIRNGSLL